LSKIMQDFLGTLTGKLIRWVLWFRREGGHALPGLVIENLFPGYVGSMLQKLPEGVVIITGTNGKTTTTKIVTHMLAANGKQVLTNPTGSNLIRGIASSLAQQSNLLGKLTYDVAVLEIDEATAKRLVQIVKPRWVVGLNVSRDQLDRYGEVDTVASYIGAAMEKATRGIITNAGDPHLVRLAEKASSKKKINVHYFGAAPGLRKFFPSDYELAAVDKQLNSAAPKAINLDVELENFDNQHATYKIDGTEYTTHLKLSGQHNFLNGAAALTLCRQLLPNVAPADLMRQLAEVPLAFGRGETYKLANGAIVELVLVKNPASFTQALASYGSKNSDLMIAINDKIADGRDVSWLWDVNLTPLSAKKIAITTGSRAADMALRLSYEDIPVQTIEPNLGRALSILSKQPGPKVVFSTYTAMLQLYGTLSKHGEKL
jgi:lipid II isoglutaminyl synthase (glutamine-hydrolysing)